MLRREQRSRPYSLVISSVVKYSTRFIPFGALPSCLGLEETIDYLAEEFDLERNDHVREVDQSVAELYDSVVSVHGC